MAEFSVGDTNCILAYEFQDNSNDLSGEGHNGTLNGTAAYATDGINSKCVTLDGNSDYVQTADTATLDVTGTITLAAWVKRNSGDTTGERGIISKGGVYNLICYDDGKARVEIHIGGGIRALRSDNVVVTTGAWFHVAGTYDGSDMHLYINGVEVAPSPDPYTGAIGTNNDSVRVGLHSAGYWHGEIDRAFIFNVAKSQSDILAEYDAFQATFEQEGFRFRADDGSQTTATWLATQDTNITRARGLNTRLRFLVNATGDPSTTEYRLDHKLSIDGVWTAVPASTGPTVTSYVVNPSFENNITDGCGTFGSGVTNSRVTSEFKFGSASYQATAASPSDGGLIISNISLPAGTYYASAWVKTGANVTNACTVLRTGSQVFQSNITSANQDWQRVSGSFSLGSTTNVEWVVGLGAYGSTSQGTAWWDGFMITATSLYDYFAGDSTSDATYTYAWSSTAHNSTSTRTLKVKIHYSASTNITASGEATTAQLTAPTGKTTGDFVTGRMQDDENPADTIDISADDYTELEWCLYASTDAVDAEIWQFRISKNGSALDTYTLTPEWTLGSGGSLTNPKFLVFFQ